MQSQKQILVKHLRELERSGLCDFETPRKRAYYKAKIESNEQRMEKKASRNNCVEEDAILDRADTLQKSIIARIVPKPGLGLLNLSEMD